MTVPQALVQFSDANTASSAKSALEGRSIPRSAFFVILKNHIFVIFLKTPQMYSILDGQHDLVLFVVLPVGVCRYLLPDHVGPCHLRISFSAHNDLNVKFQSHRSR